MGKLYEPGRVALASQRDLATNVLYQCGILDNEFAHLPDDNRHHIRRDLGYTNWVNIRAHGRIGGLGLAGSARVQVVKPPWYKPPWFIIVMAIVAGIGYDVLKWIVGLLNPFR